MNGHFKTISIVSLAELIEEQLLHNLENHTLHHLEAKGTSTIHYLADGYLFDTVCSQM